MQAFATKDDLEILWRKLKVEEEDRAKKLLEIVSDSLREEAYKVGVDLDKKVEERPSFFSVLKSVTVDVVARTLMTSTDSEPMTSTSESALGYSWSGNFLVPGGGLFIKDSELKRLGLKKQKYGVIEFYDTPKRGASYFDKEAEDRD